MMLFVSVLVAFTICTVMIRYICKPDSPLHLLDHPNDRSLHTRAVPRTGGIAILAGISIAVGFLSLTVPLSPALIPIGVAVYGLAFLSFIDDRQGLPVRVRLLGQIVAAALIIGSGLVLTGAGLATVSWQWPYPLGVLISVIFLVWMTNLYNFMDGMDGFAGGMTVLGFGTYAILGMHAGAMEFSVICAIVAASALAFLVSNFPPAKLFMGDSGSAPLGLLAGTLAIWAERQHLFPFWVSILVFSPFIVDSTVTLIRRLLRRERIWKAHKSHYYQRLVQLGWGHRRTVMAEYMLMIGCGITALVTRYLDTRMHWVLIAGWIAIYLSLATAVRLLERKSGLSR